ncbi:MAG TPA: protein translocase subunit SecF [Candidatus Limnocylindrales bacterium]|nr:protein translocase subunit SecF [Candidatus Limnocylindrales bacterium]
MFDIVGKRNWFFAFSLLITIPGLIFILLTPITNGAEGLKFSIDYTGGTEWSIKFEDPNVTADQVRTELAALGQEDAQVTRTGSGFLDIRMSKLDLRDVEPAPTAGPTDEPTPSPLPSGQTPAPTGTPPPTATPEPTPTPAPTGTPNPGASPGPTASAAPGAGAIPTQGEIGAIATGLQAKFGPIAEQAKLSSIGAVVSSDLIQQAFLLIIIGALGILGWITLRFRDVKFGVTALVALLHDVIVVLGIFAMLGTLFGVKVDGLFVTAMLTVIGFSVHDTIVVFDRVRENRARHAGEPFSAVVNHSILQTFGRSITTSFTVALTLATLLLFGGSATQEFVLALLIGIISGTYSSIFNAAPLLVVWHEWEDRRLGRLQTPAKPSRASV